MERLINPLSDPSIWSDPDRARVNTWDGYIVQGRPSTLLDPIDPITLTFNPPLDISEFTQLAMNVAVFRAREGDDIVFSLDDVTYKFPHINKSVNRIIFPLTEDQTELKELTIHSPLGKNLIVANLIGMKPELPADLLEMFKRGLDDVILNKNYQLPIGNVSCKKGDTSVILEGDCDWLERYEVLVFGDKRYQVGNKVDHRISFLTTYDGDTVVEDFTGMAYVVLPVEIGFYDREIALPSISLWYNSPTPIQRNGHSLSSVSCIIDDDILITENPGAYMKWKITIEIAARSPQLVQLMASCIRLYLLRGGDWCNGIKLNWFWKEPVQDTEPVADYDIVPRANYGIEIEIYEEVYEPCQRNGTKKLNLRVFPHR